MSPTGTHVACDSNIWTSYERGICEIGGKLLESGCRKRAIPYRPSQDFRFELNRAGLCQPNQRRSSVPVSFRLVDAGVAKLADAQDSKEGRASQRDAYRNAACRETN